MSIRLTFLPIIYNIYSRIGILRENNEPAFYPLPRVNLETGRVGLSMFND